MPLQIEATDAKGYELHPEDEWLNGQVVAIEETDGQWGPGLKWIIELDDDEPHDDGSPWETWAFCSQKLSPRSKLYGWLKGLGYSVEPGDTVDLEDVVGKRCQVMFEHVDGYDNDGNPVEREKVTKIRKGPKKDATSRKAKKMKDEDLEAPF